MGSSRRRKQVSKDILKKRANAERERSREMIVALESLRQVLPAEAFAYCHPTKICILTNAIEYIRQLEHLLCSQSPVVCSPPSPPA